MHYIEVYPFSFDNRTIPWQQLSAKKTKTGIHLAQRIKAGSLYSFPGVKGWTPCRVKPNNPSQQQGNVVNAGTLQWSANMPKLYSLTCYDLDRVIIVHSYSVVRGRTVTSSSINIVAGEESKSLANNKKNRQFIFGFQFSVMFVFGLLTLFCLTEITRR